MYSILAIDDSSFHLRVIKEMLADHYEVFPAISESIAFRYLEKKKPDLILLDVVMPGMDGREIFKKLKVNPEYSDIAVIFLTSQNDRITEVECFELGAYDFIPKSVDGDVFLSRIRKALNIKEHGKKLQKKLDEKTKALESASLVSVNAMAALVDARDTYTKGHSERVATYSVMIAENMGWNRLETKNLYEVALLHDVGKVGVPDCILLKSTDLTSEEMVIMKRHTIIGADILKDFTAFTELELGARYHHERFDGKGYPEGLKGTEIPLLARIICVADSFDAMSSNRCYRKRLSRDKIRQELLRGSGKQFDPEVVFAFLKSWNNLFTEEDEKQRNG